MMSSGKNSTGKTTAGWFAAALLATTLANAAEPDVDALTGLKKTGDWELVRNNCIACHSLKLITQQRGSAEQWFDMIRWMQEKQNLWQFDPDVEKRIVAYLAENYAPSERQRRAALAPGLMPSNPYARNAD